MLNQKNIISLSVPLMRTYIIIEFLPEEILYVSMYIPCFLVIFHVNHVQVVLMLSCCRRNKVQTLNQLDTDSRKLRDLDALGLLVAIGQLQPKGPRHHKSRSFPESAYISR